MPEIRMIIAGGRDFKDYDLLRRTVIERVPEFSRVTVLSGKCSGADELGEQCAGEFGFPVEGFPADWNKHGKQAGYIRNKEMAETATHCICFWDGKSKGTKLMIDIAKQKGLNLTVINYD